jgi:hypothetical protein
VPIPLSKNSARKSSRERPGNFFTELKRPGPNVYKFVVSFVPCGETSRLFELARVLVRLDHVASFIVNADHGIVRAAVEFRVADCIADCVWLAVPRQSKWRFDRKINRGFGISALFSGDSGTGKTMVAEVLAGALRLNLYRVDSENRVLATSLSLCINS